MMPGGDEVIAVSLGDVKHETVGGVHRGAQKWQAASFYGSTSTSFLPMDICSHLIVSASIIFVTRCAMYKSLKTTMSR